MKTWAIIPTAGRGSRFGQAKQFLSLGHKPLFLRTLQIFELTPAIDAICLLIPPEQVSTIRSDMEKIGLKKVHWIVPGGRERQESVSAGFRSLPVGEMVVVHDGVRPFVTPDLIEKVVSAAREFGAATTALPIQETIKKSNAEGLVQETVDRSSLWSIQTPQAFRYEILKEALERAERDRFLGTDEAMLVERIGHKVKLVPGSPLNIKITTPEDLTLAEAILKSELK